MRFPWSTRESAKYFDVEMQVIPLEKNCYTITAEGVAPLINKNTIAVEAILGTTYSGQAAPIEEGNDLWVRIKQEKGWALPLHVDAASGGLGVPFTDPDFVWDFRLADTGLRTLVLWSSLFYQDVG